MTKRETRVINAFINCVRTGEFTEDYAVTLIEDNQRYGWLTDAAKEEFYDALEKLTVETIEVVNDAHIAVEAPNFAPVAPEPSDEEEPTEDDETQQDAPQTGTEPSTGDEPAETDETEN